jgi:sugar porter (SP) family MFS transporter
MQNNIWAWAITVALGGFLFGFDTAVISGINQLLEVEWGLSKAAVGQMVAAALYGTVIGALGGGFPADAFGRKKTLILIAALFLLSAIGSAASQDVIQLSIARFIGGLGVGASSVVAPMYITEMAPAKHRGQLVAAFQFNLVLGILVAYFSNFAVTAAGQGENWRLMLGVEVVPALLFLLLLFRVPRSPRWLVTKANRPDEALDVLRRIEPDRAEQELAAIRATNTTGETVPIGEFFSRRYRRPIGYAFVFALFNQISGINAVIYFAPDIFAAAGLARESALLGSVGIGVVNVVFTLLGMALIDRAGRKKLMYIGSVGYIVSLGAVAWAFYSGDLSGWTVPGWLFVFIASHAIGQGAVIWVFISEIFGNEVRGLGASLGSGTHWVFAALISGTFPFLAARFGEWPLFAFFAVCMVGQLLWVHFVMPETKGVDLEELQRELQLNA